jgi:hypothetical protein
LALAIGDKTEGTCNVNVEKKKTEEEEEEEEETTIRTRT